MPNESATAAQVGNHRATLLEAVILHHRDYRETSLLLEAFSAEQGRLSLLAKGAKRGRNAGSHTLQAFVPLRLSWTGRGELPVLTAAETNGDAISLNGTALYCGFYMNELLLRLLPPHDPYPEIFQLYLDSLRRLAVTGQYEQVLRGFEVGLLEHIGYGLSLEQEAGSGHPIDPDQTYEYLIDQGPVATHHPGANSIHGSTLLGLRRDNLDNPGARLEAKRLMRRVIDHYLDGRALKSRDLFKQLGKARTA